MYKNKLPKDFNVIEYKLLNNDLKNMSNDQAIRHFLTHGLHENRAYKFDNSTKDYKLQNKLLNRRKPLNIIIDTNTKVRIITIPSFI